MSLSEYRNPTSAREVRKFFEYLCAMNWTCWGAQAYRQPASVGWGKTRAQRAPHPNTPISKLQPVDWNRRYTHSADLSGTRNIAVGLHRSFLAVNPTYRFGVHLPAWGVARDYWAGFLVNNSIAVKTTREYPPPIGYRSPVLVRFVRSRQWCRIFSAR